MAANQPSLSLRLIRPYLSLPTLSSPLLGKFTVITGLNGVGKTQLLRGISYGVVENNLVSAGDRDDQIKYYSYDMINLADFVQLKPSQITEERAHILAMIKEGVREAERFARQAVQDFEELARFSDSPIKLTSLSDDEISELISLARSSVRSEFSSAIFMPRALLLEKLSVEQRLAVLRASEVLQKPAYEMTEYDLQVGRVPDWGGTSLFKQDILRSFLAYRDARQRNLMAKAASDMGQPNVEYLTDADFIVKFGLPPWDLINRALEKTNLGFQVKEPDPFSTTDFRPVLVKDGAEIPFQELSSGEKIIVSLAFVSYYSKEDRQKYTVPKLILLDELDAYLHPAMTQSLLAAVKGVLVDLLGAHVIMTTHSPSTIALAPEEAIHVLKPGGILDKASKDEALRLLTVGVPTLAIDFSGRRQVLCESDGDADTYARIYGVLAPSLLPGRSLEFVGVGSSKGAGKQNVKALVTGLREKGVASAYGLLDWDLEETSTDSISILAEGKFRALENVMFHPFLLAAITIVMFKSYAPPVGLSEKFSIDDFWALDNTKLQAVISEVSVNVLSADGRTTTEKQAGHRDYRDREAWVQKTGNLRAVTCPNGVEVYIDNDYFEAPPHELERKVVSAMQYLKQMPNLKVQQSSGSLMRAVAVHLFIDHPKLIPAEFYDLFSNLLSK